MEILITGGTGLIGRGFIQQFNKDQITVLTRSRSKAKTLLPDEVKRIDSLESLQNLDGFDAVINLAGEPIIDKRWSDQQKNIITQSRCQITQQLVDLFACSLNPPEVFLSGSAIGVYGNRGDEVLTELSEVQQSDFASQLCLRWEETAKQAEPYTRVVLLRTGIVLSPNGGALGKMLFPFKCFLGGPIGSGRQYMSWIHHQDCISALHYLLTVNSLSGVINVVAPNAVTNTSFTRKLARSLRRIAILPMPKIVLKYLLGESSSLLLDSQRVAPKALLDSGFNFRFTDLKPALEDILK
jgi:uncharacterized protein (TIGR01777 family)